MRMRFLFRGWLTFEVDQSHEEYCTIAGMSAVSSTSSIRNASKR